VFSNGDLGTFSTVVSVLGVGGEEVFEVEFVDVGVDVGEFHAVLGIGVGKFID